MLWRCTYKQLPPLEIEAKSTKEAGDLAATQWFKEGHGPVDPLCVDVRRAAAPASARQVVWGHDDTQDDCAPITGWPYDPGWGATPQSPIGDDEDTPILDPFTD